MLEILELLFAAGMVWLNNKLSFGIKSYQLAPKSYISFEAHVSVEMIDDEINFLVLASYPLWKVMPINQRLVNESTR